MTYTDTDKRAVSFEMNLEIEPRLGDFATANCQVIEVITEADQSLPVKKSERSGSWNSSRNGTQNISEWSGPKIEDLSPDIKKLKKLTVEIPCKFVLGTTRIKFDNVMDAVGTSKKTDELTLSIEEILKPKNALHIKVQIKGKTAGLSRDLKPVLVNEAGQTVTQGLPTISTRSSGRLSATFEFHGIDHDSTQTESLALQFSLPTDSITRKYQFTFEDVLIP